MISRREWLRMSGEQIPVIGLGGRWISANSTPEELVDQRVVLHELARDAEAPGRLFDSDAGYGGGGSEEYAGQRIGDRELPEWAHEFDAHSWAQFMLKFVVAHPAVTVACPGTGDPAHRVDNLGGGRGRLPTEEHLERMVGLVGGLPTS